MKRASSRVEDIPKWVPILPETTIASHFSITRHAQRPDRDSFIDGEIELTGEAATRNLIYDYYRTELARQGFEIESPPPHLSASTPEEPSRYLLVSLRADSVYLKYTEWFKTPPSGAGRKNG